MPGLSATRADFLLFDFEMHAMRVEAFDAVEAHVRAGSVAVGTVRHVVLTFDQSKSSMRLVH